MKLGIHEMSTAIRSMVPISQLRGRVDDHPAFNVGALNLKTALEMRSEWSTASNQKRLQTLTISPFWSDAEQFKVPSKQPLAAPLHF
jgi:hypothetical protein